MSRRSVASLLLTRAVAAAQETFRVESTLILVRFSAMRGREFVTDLTAGDILLSEDRQAQKIALFEGPLSAWQERVSVDFHLLVDISGTMDPYLALTSDLLRQTLLHHRPQQTKVSIHAFAYHYAKLAGPTNTPAEIERAIRQLQTADLGQRRRSASGIYDAILELASGIVGNQFTRSVLIVLSDGLDTGKHTGKDASKAAKEKQLVVYPVMVVPKHEWQSEDAMKEFTELGPATGGRALWPPAMTREALARILEHVVNQVAAEYTVGYYPGPGSGRPRSRNVKVSLRKQEGVAISGGVRTVMY